MCQLYLREPHAGMPGTPKGWTVRYTTDLSDEVWFYLRGEEYSAQIDYFAASVQARRLDGENNSASALDADKVVAMLLGEAATTSAVSATEAPRKGFWSRLTG